MPHTPRPACFSVPACLYFCSAVSPDAWCPKSATARFGCKQRKAGNGIGAAPGGAAQRATAGRRSARSEQSSCACPTCVWVDPQTEPFEGRGKTKRTSDRIDDIESNPERPEIWESTTPRVARCGLCPEFLRVTRTMAVRGREVFRRVSGKISDARTILVLRLATALLPAIFRERWLKVLSSHVRHKLKCSRPTGRAVGHWNFNANGQISLVVNL